MSEEADDQDEDDEEDVIYHGTDLSAADKIFGAKKFDERDGTYFAATRGLAFYFARRTVNKRGSGSPAIVKVVLYKADLRNWIKSRFVQSRGFDESDAGELRGKTQLDFGREGVRLLNALSFKNDWSVETRL